MIYKKGRLARAIRSTYHSFKDGELIELVGTTPYTCEWQQVFTFCSVNNKRKTQDLIKSEFEWLEETK